VAYSLLATSPPASIGNGGGSPHCDDGDASRGLGVADWLRLQRHSSGSSAGDDGDGFSSVSTLATADKGGDPADRPAGSSGGGGSKSWAQQAEEAYQLQLALALRLCSEASTAPDPNFLDSAVAAADDHHRDAPSPQSLSHRFWVRTHRVHTPVHRKMYTDSPSDHLAVLAGEWQLVLLRQGPGWLLPHSWDGSLRMDALQ
jgi:serine/threonine-protein kinase CTR1